MAPFEGTWDCSTWSNLTSIIHSVTSKLTTAWFCCYAHSAPPPGAGFAADHGQMETVALVLLQTASLEKVLSTEHSSGVGPPCSSHLGCPKPCLLLWLVLSRACPQLMPVLFLQPPFPWLL